MNFNEPAGNNVSLDHGRSGGERRRDLVLLVDHDPAARARAAAALSARCWRVIEAGGGAEALEMFAAHRPDVVVLDASMTGMDGFAICERLRRLRGGEHVPVLMLTALDDEVSIARAYEAGATDFQGRSGTEWALLSERLRYMVRAARLREELAEHSDKLSKAQRIARLGNWDWNVAARSVRLSAEGYAIAGLPHQDQAVSDWFIWSRVVADERPRLEELFRDALSGVGALNFDCRILRPSGEVRIVHVEAEIERDVAGAATAMHGVVQDITERKHAEDRIRELANFDSLTGLPNRRHFRDQFSAALERARAAGTAVGVLFIDLDRFKQINDKLGHQVGDELLRAVAKRIVQCVRENDVVALTAVQDASSAPRQATSPQPSRGTGRHSRSAPAPGQGNSVARLGGDEFTILLTDLPTPAAIEAVAQRLMEAMRRPFRVAGNELLVTSSIGLATYPADGHDVDSLLRKADIAMYAVKDSGRNGLLRFSSGMKAATSARRRLETSLQRALDRQELVLYYQPKVNVLDGTIAGAEALMRWRRGGELVPPGEFIAAAEESGLIVPITEWAVREVCRQLSRWAEAGMAPVPVSVNISGRHLQHANLLEPVEAALRGVRLDPGLLELELTEAVLMHDFNATLPLLQALKQLGLSISVDDFGTGFSSLAHLTRLPIDTLKIDRSFVHDLETRPESAAIVAVIMAMSRSLNLRVVAEGVETRGQMARLFEQGCHLMQGFLFSPAVPGEDFPALVKGERGATHWRIEAGAATAPGTEGGALQPECKRGPGWSAVPAGADHALADVRARSA
jgi:predicted signal transduction protein with EAL and GGDEF domain/DNA-binding response OmpR family regulator